MRIPALFLTLVLAATAMPAHADSILYDNLRPPRLGTAGTLMDEYVPAEDVLLKRPTHVTGLTFWASIRGPELTLTDIEWLVFRDDAGWPGTEIARGLSPMTRTLLDPAVPGAFSVDIPLDVTLDPGLTGSPSTPVPWIPPL